jgi:hypothetical protein
MASYVRRPSVHAVGKVPILAREQGPDSILEARKVTGQCVEKAVGGFARGLGLGLAAIGSASLVYEAP